MRQLVSVLYLEYTLWRTKLREMMMMTARFKDSLREADCMGLFGATESYYLVQRIPQKDNGVHKASLHNYYKQVYEKTKLTICYVISK